jgi:hypothetical protein
MRATVVTVRDPFRPACGREIVTLRRRRSIRALAPRTRLPTICLLNGQPILRASWRRKVRDGDVVVFACLPAGGGGGSDPIRIVAMLAVMVVAPYAATQVAYAAFAAGVTGTAYAAVYWGALAGVSLAGMAVVNTLLPPPRPPTPQQMQAIAAPSPTYSLQAQGNQARLGSAIPVIYGRHLIYPDFGAQPYTEYAGNEQFLYQLLVIGQGQYSIESIRIEDTVVQANPTQDGATYSASGAWEDISYQICYDQEVTLFPANVTTSVEVSGQEALTGTPLGPYVASAAGTSCNAIAVDVIAPRGLYQIDTGTGALLTMSMTFTVEARQIDNSGVPMGTWTTLGSETISAATTTPQRYSFRYSVAQARYEVRLTRTDTKQTGSNYAHDLLWTALRAYHPGSQNYGKITVLAMRMKASNQLSQLAAHKINCIVTRKLPVWNGSSWSSPQATRAIAWAIADILRADYGAKLPDSRIDLSGLLALDSVWSQRHDYYDAVHDSVQTVWEALTQAARAGRALPYIQGGIVHIVRDSAQTVPVQIYSMRNIVLGSLSLNYAMPSEETADAVDVQYFDSQVWTQRTVRAALPGSTAEKPVNIRLFGVTSRDQAWREGMYIAAANRYRRRHLTFATEMEGFIPSIGDLIAVSHDMPQWGQSGEVTAYDSATRAVTTSEPLTWGSGTHYIALRKRDGSVAGPYQVTKGLQANQAVLQSAPAITPDTGGGRERTHYAFGAGQALYMLARVVGIRPRSPERVEIAAVVESDYVHTADSGAAPTPGAWQLPADFTVPQVQGLTIRSTKDEVTQALLSWRPAPGAERYIIEAAYGSNPSDPSLVWTRVGDTSASSFTVRAIYGTNTVFRVAAVGATRGPWVGALYGTTADYMWAPSGDPMWTPATSLMWV